MNRLIGAKLLRLKKSGLNPNVFNKKRSRAAQSVKAGGTAVLSVGLIYSIPALFGLFDSDYFLIKSFLGYAGITFIIVTNLMSETYEGLPDQKTNGRKMGKKISDKNDM